MARGSTRLFSSALFCLWLSTASLVVWMDFGTRPASRVAAAEVAADPVGAARQAVEPAQPAAPTDAIKHH